MADGGRRYGLAPKLDLGIILTEAQHRWLRPAEVCEILRNYKKFQLSSEPPHKPTGSTSSDGSLFLFDRKALRYFRKDGLKWRKKKDGKTVREAHERLKSGSIDVLHCYYAHGEDNEHFQRRSYWMLEEQFEHIVLVHYREIKEGNKTGTYPSTSSQRSMQVANSTVNTSHVLSGQARANSPLGQKSYASSPSMSEWNGTNHSSDFEEVESGDDIANSVNIETDSSSVEHGCSQLQESNRDLPIEASFQQLEFGKEFANLSAENEPDCSSYALNKMLPGHFPLGGLETVHRNLFEHASEPQVTLPYQDSYVPEYCKREVLNLADNLGLQQDRFSGHVQFPSAVTSEVPGCGYVNIGGNATESGADVITSGQDINSSTWTEVLELCKSHIPNAARERNTTNVTSATLDDFLGRQTQTGITFQTLKDNEVSIRNDAARSACLQTAVGPGSSEQDQIQGSDYSLLNDLQERMLNFNDGEQVREPVSLQKFQERRLEVENKVKLENGDSENLSNVQINKQKLQHCNSSSDFQEKLKKLDSFNRWMNGEMGVDSDKALFSGDPGMYWASLGDQNGVEEIPNLTRHMQLENDLMVPSVSQVQLYSILEFSPDWAYTQSKTKVLIYGMFMGDQDIYKQKFSVMFGEHEVSAEVLGPGILRCYTPPHAPGTVPFYVTCSNRVACSEVREFQYKVAPFQEPHSSKDMDENVIHEILLKMRFAKLINQDFDKTVVSLKEKGDLNLRHSISSLISDFGEEWKELEHSLKEQQLCSEKIQERLTQKLLKDKLYYWLLWKSYNGEGPNSLDDCGQGLIHLAAALGYDWAMSPIISSGVNVNFRDLRGWTALHWAAYYGRERTISSLIALKANPGALTDPTHEFPSGRTSADLAASKGNKGIAGYLAESSLTSHLSSLTLNENIMGSVVATLAAEKAVETVSERNVVQSDGGREDQLSLKDSLAAVRNAAQAAARIQASFRMHSFRRRQAIECVEAKQEFTERQTLSRFSKASKSGSHEEPLHAAATHIQRKFRGWKGRKEFLLTRQRIVKIQAHFRGHQVRKKYRLVWSVGIVEKAILRWRRKGTGLRGFRSEDIEESSQNIKRPEIDDYEYLRAARKQTEAGVEKALARVQSMVQYPDARDQYRRLLGIYKESKADIESNMLES